MIAAETEAVARGLPPGGSFVSKQMKGNTYWYLQRQVAGHREQHYLGPESESLRAWMDRVREARDELRWRSTARTKTEDAPSALKQRRAIRIEIPGTHPASQSRLGVKRAWKIGWTVVTFRRKMTADDTQFLPR